QPEKTQEAAARSQSPHPVQDLQGGDPQVPHRFHGSLHQQPRRTGFEDDESEDQNLRRLPNRSRRRRLRPPALRDLVGPKAGLQHPQSPDPHPRTTGRRLEALSRNFPSPPFETPSTPRTAKMANRDGGLAVTDDRNPGWASSVTVVASGAIEGPRALAARLDGSV